MPIAPRRIVLLGVENNDATASVTGVITGTSRPVESLGAGIATIYLRSIGTTSGGTVIVEEADSTPYESIYAGTWSQIASVAASSFTGGAQSAVHITNSAFGQVRVRISSTITGGGTISAVFRDQAAGS